MHYFNHSVSSLTLFILRKRRILIATERLTIQNSLNFFEMGMEFHHAKKRKLCAVWPYMPQYFLQPWTSKGCQTASIYQRGHYIHDVLPQSPLFYESLEAIDHSHNEGAQIGEVATDTDILCLRTRYRTKLGRFFWFYPIQRCDTIKGKWQIVYLRTTYRTKLGWFFWFGTILETIRRNLANWLQFYVLLQQTNWSK